MRRKPRVEEGGSPTGGSGDDHRTRMLAGIPVREGRAVLAGIPTAVLEGGSGPPLVLLHGPGESAVNWRWVLPELVAGHRVVAPDLPAHGDTGGEDERLDARRVLDWLEELIRRYCPAPPVLVGHVLGGALAARYAATRHKPLRGLVLVDALGLAPFRPKLRFLLAMLGFQARPSERTYRWFMKQCAFDREALRERMGDRWETFVSYNVQLARSPKSKAAGRLFRKLGLPRIPPEDLERIRVPTALVWGRHDRALPLRIAEAASERYGWPLHVVEEAADDPFRDRPGAFLQALRSILDDFPSPYRSGGRGSPSHPHTQQRGRTMRGETPDRSADGAGSAVELEATRGEWDAVAPGYDEFVTPRWALGEEALDHAGLEPDMRFLDVACGSGALSLPAARLGARVTAVDLSPVMIDRFRARAREEGLTDVVARVMDGHALDFEDGSFDVVGSQFGVMLFPDLPRALREMVRVTRPGGRVLMVVYGAPEEVEFLTFFIPAMQAVVPDFTGLPSDPPPLPFQVADPTVLRERMTAAGLRQVRIEPTVERLTFGSGAELWDWVTNSNPIATGMVEDLTEEQRRAVRRELDGRLRERSGGRGPAVLECAVHAGIGTK